MARIKWGPWDPEWRNETAKHDSEVWEYTLIPKGGNLPAGDSFVYEHMNDDDWFECVEYMNVPAPCIVRRRRRGAQ